MKKLHGLAAAAVAALAGSAMGTPLRLDYCVTDLGGGTFHYVFVLTLDNHDNTWAAGQAWRWLIFGDADGSAGPATSPLTNWVDSGTVWPVGPWTGFTSSGGGHNGPTFDFVLDYWTPAGVGDSLVWEGNSTADLQEPTVLFSTLAGTLGGGVAADFEVAHRLTGGCLGPTGACCRPDGSCLITTNATCTAQSGIYRGDNSVCATANCPQPPPGACCLPGGACSLVTHTVCTAESGVFRGENTNCATANCPNQYLYDDGTIDNALGPTVTGGAAFANNFTCVAGADKITQVEIAFGCYDLLNGLPITVVLESDPDGDGTPNDAHVLTSLDGVISGASPSFPIPSATWVTFDITDTIIPVGQKFFVGFIMQNSPSGQFPGAFDQTTAAHRSWWGYSAGTFDPNAWTGFAELTTLGYPGNWLIRADAAPSAAACYPNCDHSTAAPCLNVGDFVCFLNEFASGDDYANCDHSTIPPVLNIGDFNCFINSFAAGCGTNC